MFPTMKFLLKVGKFEILCYVPLLCRKNLFQEVDNLNIYQYASVLGDNLLLGSWKFSCFVIWATAFYDKFALKNTFICRLNEVLMLLYWRHRKSELLRNLVEERSVDWQTSYLCLISRTTKYFELCVCFTQFVQTAFRSY